MYFERHYSLQELNCIIRDYYSCMAVKHIDTQQCGEAALFQAKCWNIGIPSDAPEEVSEITRVNQNGLKRKTSLGSASIITSKTKLKL